MVRADGLPGRGPVSYLVGDAFLGLTEYELCHRQPLERALSQPGIDLAGERERWAAVVDLARRGDVARVLQDAGHVPFARPPEGTSWIRWADWVTARLGELADGPSAVTGPPRHLEHWQRREGEVDAAAVDALRRALSRVPLPAGTSRRDHVVIDVGRPVGSAGAWRDGEFHEEPTTRVGLVLERTDRVRVVAVHAADPIEDGRAPGWRARWPVLAAALGGWFSLGALADRTPASAQYAMLAAEDDAFLAALAGEGAELLQLDDDDLHAAVVALGSYVEPGFLRSWLEWLVWRIGHFDWK